MNLGPSCQVWATNTTCHAVHVTTLGGVKYKISPPLHISYPSRCNIMSTQGCKHVHNAGNAGSASWLYVQQNKPGSSSAQGRGEFPQVSSSMHFMTTYTPRHQNIGLLVLGAALLKSSRRSRLPAAHAHSNQMECCMHYARQATESKAAGQITNMMRALKCILSIG